MIHRFQMNGSYIVLDVFSGSVHVVDEVAYEAIGLYEGMERGALKEKLLQDFGAREDVNVDELDELFLDIEALRQEGRLFSKDPLRALQTNDLPRGEHVLKALCLHVAHACNLDCAYCFARQGKYHGEEALMSFDVGKRALDMLIEKSGTRRNLEVDFFGGEPLLNWEVVKQLVDYARSREQDTGKNFRFTFTTNGVLLNDEIIAYLNREMHNVVLSLDGRQQVHDRWRHNLAGEGSYDKVLPKFRALVEARGGKDYYMRGTFTRDNLDFTQDIFHMADLGFHELSMEPVVCDPQEPYALQEGDLPVLYEQYEILAEEMARRRRQGRPFRFYHFQLDLQGGPCLPKRLVGCGSGTEYLAVTPSGDLYPCHQFVSEQDFCAGNVWDGLQNPALQEDFRSCNICQNSDCRDCWAQLYCAGGCAANAYHATGDIHGTYHYGCKLFKKRMECALWLELTTRA